MNSPAPTGDERSMTFREMNLAVFRGEALPHVFCQPRIEPWLFWQKEFGELPEDLRGLDVREVYERIGASMRYMHYYTGLPSPVTERFSDEVKITAPLAY